MAADASDEGPVPQPIPAELEHRWSVLGIDPRELVPDAKGTIGAAEADASYLEATIDPTVVVPPSPPGRSPAPTPSAAPHFAPDPTAITLGPVLGGGGMGLVHLAEQPSLRREVAVKRLRPEHATPTAVGALLREAWITGTLEHPNIVPIHLLVWEEGLPRVVMKRVEGVTWETLFASPELLAELGGAGAKDTSQDRLRFHLRILIDVCRAVHFAHSRGILHLDLKPENVMVGRFGEVYLVDWGIAASLPGVGPAWLPPTTQITSVRGTPAWMPPELAAADGEHIDPATDVFLLGGLLHAILTDNQPRHRNGDLVDMLTAAYLSLPYRYPPTTPVELAELANRATSRDPAARPASAEAFRRALEDHLEHRHSTELAQRAHDRMQHLVTLFRRGGKGPAEATQAGQNLRREFLECRFGFQQALEIWPANERARDGLRALLSAMGRYALDNRQLERATECVTALSPRDPELDRRLRELGAEMAEQHERLQALEHDADPDAFHRQRSRMALGAGLLFIAWNATLGLLHRSGTFVFEVTDLLWLNGLTIAVFATSAWVVRRSLLTTATNRRIVVLFGSGFFAVFLFWLAAWVHGLEHPARALGALEVVALSNWVYAFFLLAVAFTMDGRAAWMLPPAAAIAVLSPLFTPWAFELLGIEGTLCGVWLSYIWRTPRARAIS